MNAIVTRAGQVLLHNGAIPTLEDVVGPLVVLPNQIGELREPGFVSVKDVLSDAPPDGPFEWVDPVIAQSCSDEAERAISQVFFE